MKEIIIALFATREDAEKTIKQLHRDVGIDPSDVSYIYRTAEGASKRIDAESVMQDTPKEGAQRGAVIGGSLGAVAGLATVAGVIPVIGPIFAAGPLVAALGIGAGALSTTAAAAVTGAAAGGLIGALVAWGTPEDVAQAYEKRVLEGDVLVATQSEEYQKVRAIMERNDALEVSRYEMSV